MKGLLLQKNKNALFQLSDAAMKHIMQSEDSSHNVGALVALSGYAGGAATSNMKFAREIAEKYDFEEIVSDVSPKGKRGFFRWWMVAVLLIVIWHGVNRHKSTPTVMLGTTNSSMESGSSNIVASSEADKYGLWTRHVKLLEDVYGVRKSILELGARLYKEDASGGASEELIKDAENLTREMLALIQRVKEDKVLPAEMIKALRLPQDIGSQWESSQNDLVMALSVVNEYVAELTKMAIASRKQDVNAWNQCIKRTNVYNRRGKLDHFLGRPKV